MEKIELGEMLHNAMNLAIADELLKEDGFFLPETEIQRLLDIGKGNPWNVPILHAMFALTISKPPHEM